MYEIIKSLKDSISSKIRSPFWGTFLIVLFIQHWPLFYSLFVFDKNTNRLERLNVIEGYITDSGGTLYIFGYTALWTIAALFVSNVLTNIISAFISNWFEYRTLPWVINVATRGKRVVDKEHYEKLQVAYKGVLARNEDMDNLSRQQVSEVNKLYEIIENRNKRIEELESISTVGIKAEEEKAKKFVASLSQEEKDSFYEMVLKLHDESMDGSITNMFARKMQTNTPLTSKLKLYHVIKDYPLEIQLTSYGKIVEKLILDEKIDRPIQVESPSSSQ